MRTISTVIIKPTKGCNADCTYCSAPPDGAPKWSLETFQRVFAALEPKLSPNATLIWHGGEPTLMGPVFYEQALAIARNAIPGVRFSIQTNLLSYNARWSGVFATVFDGSVSTSWDPEEVCRTVKGSPALYKRLFDDRLAKVLDDGWRPKVISTFTDQTIHLADSVYDKALEADRAGRTYDIRINYRYPAGRAADYGPALQPAAYAAALLGLYDRWIADVPGFTITPLDQMFKKAIGLEIARCPWAKGCTGRIIGIEPNLDVYNCGEFADVGDDRFKFGNLLVDGIEACLSSEPARALSRRRIDHPESCKSCAHYLECEGGCMRDSVLFGRGLYGKFFYCESWQEVFSRIKQSILTGEADRIVSKYGYDPDRTRAALSNRLSSDLARGATNMRRAVLTLGHVPSFSALHDPVSLV